ncbi:MAG: Hsp20/alpha crystallin family protein [Vulcanisaeta sp.]|jgi:HSP20 family protein|uniref:SHSP domain-containing protein n=1 Tax=Vulcanisaeta moutnovskia (strain 768-28) TaxID=985053 RepID=F0QU01_VULM7|nr:Hsp20/alpha crystallin family protein [Vulcanisaeta moutnovskia]ADY01787.1 hypothetical protein VMUT_1583 [Vulcanisaeta moutnovskia 768-28]
MNIAIRIDLGNWEIPEHGEYREPKHVIRIEGDHVIAEVEVPGVSKESIIVKLLDDDKLFIKAEGNNRKYLLIRELPVSVTVEGSHAEYRNGLLIIKLLIKGVSIGVE